MGGLASLRRLQGKTRKTKRKTKTPMIKGTKKDQEKDQDTHDQGNQERPRHL
jgi:hypothetical protein